MTDPDDARERALAELRAHTGGPRGGDERVRAARLFDDLPVPHERHLEYALGACICECPLCMGPDGLCICPDCECCQSRREARGCPGEMRDD